MLANEVALTLSLSIIRFYEFEDKSNDIMKVYFYNARLPGVTVYRHIQIEVSY